MVNTESIATNGALNENEASLKAENGNAKAETIVETTTIINDTKIGYCIYGYGAVKLLFICGGVGKSQAIQY